MPPKNIPRSLRGILWSIDSRTASLESHKEYIIHQTLMFGRLEDIRWLLETYGTVTVRRVFEKNPTPIYTRPAFHFIKNFILNMSDWNLDEKKYIASVF